MFERLEYSRFVLCDLTGLNPNVMFELGMRFRARSSGTVLFRQPGTPLPFDITGVKVFEYDTREPATARRFILQVLGEALKRNRVDSPIRRTLDQRAAEPAAPQMDGLLRDAESALASGDTATARAKYAQAVTLSPGDAVAHLRLVTLEKLRQDRNWATILAQASVATGLMPGYAEAWRGRGIAEGQLWRSATDKAAVPDGVASLRRAIELNPQDFDAHASLGGILRRQQKATEALEAYRAAVAVSEGHPYPLLNVIKLEGRCSARST
jgi:tetratricopeptide (TPR) repeat protein